MTMLLSAVVMLGIVLVGGGALVTAQDSTPAVEEEEFGEGLSFELVGAGEAEELPETPADIVLVRFGFEPGAFFEIDPEDPSVTLVVIESGALTISVDAPTTVLHPVDNGEPGPEDFEQYPAGEEFTMEEGDSAVFPANIAGEVRNDGEEDASVLAAEILSAGAGDGAEEAEGEEDVAATPVT